MKKTIMASVAVAALLLTSVQADFDFGDILKDMKDAALTMSKDTKESVAPMKDGATKTTQSAERTVTNDSKDSVGTVAKSGSHSTKAISNDSRTSTESTNVNASNAAKTVLNNTKDSVKTI